MVYNNSKQVTNLNNKTTNKFTEQTQLVKVIHNSLSSQRIRS